MKITNPSTIFVLLTVCCVDGRSYKGALLEIKHIIDGLTSLGKNENCESGWTRYQDNCYLISSDKRTWHESEEYCRRRDSFMVKVESTQEHTWIVSKLHAANVRDGLWLGGNDQARENHWVWSKDSSPISYLPWYRNAADGGRGENCLEIIGKGHPDYGKWNDVNCNLRLLTVCERELI